MNNAIVKHTNDSLTAEDVAIELMDKQTPEQDAEAERILTTNPYVGLASFKFDDVACNILMAPIPTEDIEIRADGIAYLPEIKYRRILNHAFGPGAWSLLPIDITISQEDNMLFYRGALFVHGRFVSESIGEQQYFPTNDRMSYATAAESAKSNCLTRCCKDLGIASDLWDPSFVRTWIAENAVEVWCKNVGSNPSDRGKRRSMWRRKDAPAIDMFPWREEEGGSTAKPPQSEPRPAGKKFHPPVDRDPSLITPKQAKRFNTIANEFGWTKPQIQYLLDDMRIKDVESIKRTQYDGLCNFLQDAEARSVVQEKIDGLHKQMDTSKEQKALPAKDERKKEPLEFISASQRRTLENLIARYGWDERDVADLLLENNVTALDKIVAKKFSWIMGELRNPKKLELIRDKRDRRAA